MKNIRSLLCLLLAVVLLAGCGHDYLKEPPKASSAASGQHGSTADYRQVIENARSADLNSQAMLAVVTGPDDKMHQTIFSGTYGFVEEDYERYGISIGTVITLSYGAIIILPKEGREQAVMDQMRFFVEQQKKAMDNYLQDQYEIANSALIETAPTGEVLLAMSKDAPEVMKAMKEGLAAGG